MSRKGTAKEWDHLPDLFSQKTHATIIMLQENTLFLEECSELMRSLTKPVNTHWNDPTQQYKTEQGILLMVCLASIRTSHQKQQVLINTDSRGGKWVASSYKKSHHKIQYTNTVAKKASLCQSVG